MTREEYISRKYREHLNFWAQLAIVSGGIGIIFLSPLDYFTNPSYFRQFLVYRLVTAACFAFLYLVNRRWGQRIDQGLLALLAGLIVAGMVSLMIWDTGGHTSTYYPGYIIVLIFVLGIVPLTFRLGMVAAATIYLVYLVPLLVYDTITDVSYFITANFFLLSCTIAFLFMRYFDNRKLAESFGLSYEIEQHQVRLEDEVRKRTVELQGALEKLEGEMRERKNLESQLLHAEKMKAIGLLTGGIAHEFNNILTVITGYGEILQDRIGPDDPLRKYVDYITLSAQRAAGLTTSLLAYSRKQIINPVPISMNTILKKAEALLMQIIGEDIAMTTTLCDHDLVVFADPGQMEQVLINLVTNARDAMPNGGSLTIESAYALIDDEFIRSRSFGTQGAYAVISLTDSGTGMDEETRQRIWEPFFSTKEIGKGTGLGLSMVYGIVKQNNGFIDVKSAPGAGTTFTMYLPLCTFEPKGADVPSDAPSPGGRETVLYAEDDRFVREIASHFLKKAGYQIITAENGNDALKKFSENSEKIQLLLLDVIMPGKNGKQVLFEARKIKPDIRVLFLSGYSEDIIHQHGILEEGLNYLPKPFSEQALLAKVREVFDR